MHTLLVNLALLVLALPLQTPYERDELVGLKTQASPSVFRIVAVPLDSLEINESGVYVNDLAVTGLSDELLESIELVERQLIPRGHYFVVGEQRTVRVRPNRRIVNVSRFWAIVPYNDISTLPR